MIVPAAAAARAVATSPSEQQSLCAAAGRAAQHHVTGVPSTVVEVSTADVHQHPWTQQDAVEVLAVAAQAQLVVRAARDIVE